MNDSIYLIFEIQKYCGQTEKKDKIVPLITIEELKTLNPFEGIVLMTRKMPFKTKFIPNYEIDWGYQEEYTKMSKRTPVEIKTIDI